jgi:hypothetical protein
MLIYTHCWELMNSVGSHGSLSLLFVMKVMVCHFVSDSHEVMTALIVVLPLIVVVEISLQLHRSNLEVVMTQCMILLSDLSDVEDAICLTLLWFGVLCLQVTGVDRSAIILPALVLEQFHETLGQFVDMVKSQGPVGSSAANVRTIAPPRKRSES